MIFASRKRLWGAGRGGVTSQDCTTKEQSLLRAQGGRARGLDRGHQTSSTVKRRALSREMLIPSVRLVVSAAPRPPMPSRKLLADQHPPGSFQGA